MINKKYLAVFAASILVAGLGAGCWYFIESAFPPPDQGLARERQEISGVTPQVGEIEVEGIQPKHMAVSPLRTDHGYLDLLTTDALPSEDIPFSEQASELAELALEGHPTAACRLFVGVARCTFHTTRRNFGKQVEQSLIGDQGRGDDELLIRAISQSQGRSSDAAECDGIDTSQMPAPGDYLAQAAARMSTRQKVLLAMMRADGTVVRLPREPSTEIRPGRSSDYLISQFLSDNGLRFLQEGVASSDPLALEGLILVHAPGFLLGASNGMSIAIPDPRRFAHHALLMQAVYGPETLGPFVEGMLGQTLAGMDPDTLQQIEASVASSAARWNLSVAEPLVLEGSAVGGAEPMCTAK